VKIISGKIDVNGQIVVRYLDGKKEKTAFITTGLLLEFLKGERDIEVQEASVKTEKETRRVLHLPGDLRDLEKALREKKAT
jgi:hypothetical protein